MTLYFKSNMSGDIHYTVIFTTRKGDSHIKVRGMLVVSLKGINCKLFNIWAHFWCLGQKFTVFAHSSIA